MALCGSVPGYGPTWARILVSRFMKMTYCNTNGRMQTEKRPQCCFRSRILLASPPSLPVGFCVLTIGQGCGQATRRGVGCPAWKIDEYTTGSS